MLDPLIKNGTVPPLSVFTPDFAKKYGGATDKVLLMPGPAWYAQALFDQTLHIPAGQITASAPLQWGSETPVTTGQVGGGPWIISKHSHNLKGAADFVTWATTVYNPDPTKTIYITGISIANNTCGNILTPAVQPPLPITVNPGDTINVTFVANANNSANQSCSFDFEVTWGHAADGSDHDHSPITVHVVIPSTPPDCVCPPA